MTTSEARKRLEERKAQEWRESGTFYNDNPMEGLPEPETKHDMDCACEKDDALYYDKEDDYYYPSYEDRKVCWMCNEPIRPDSVVSASKRGDAHWACDMRKTLKGPIKGYDPVEQPEHYTHSRVEVWDAIDAWGLGYRLGNVIKYVARADRKGKPLEDLRKARAYLDREIATRQQDARDW